MLISLLLCILAPLKHSKHIIIANRIWNGDVFWKWCQQIALKRAASTQHHCSKPVCLSGWPPVYSTSASAADCQQSHASAPALLLFPIFIQYCSTGWTAFGSNSFRGCQYVWSWSSDRARVSWALWPGTSVNLEGIVWHETEEGKYNLFWSIPPCPLPCDVSVSTCNGNLLCGIQRGKKSGFYALLIFVEIRAMFLFLFMAAFTFLQEQSGVYLRASPL